MKLSKKKISKDEDECMFHIQEQLEGTACLRKGISLYFNTEKPHITQYLNIRGFWFAERSFG